MVPLAVWSNIGITILDWIDLATSLGVVRLPSRWSSVVLNWTSSVSRIRVVSTDRVDVSSPGFKVRVVVMLLVPGSLPLWVLATDGGLDWVVLSESSGSSLGESLSSISLVFWLTIVKS